jgi:hypothetical protein
MAIGKISALPSLTKAAYRGDEMLNQCTKTPMSDILQSIAKWKSCRMKPPAAALGLLFLSCALWAQGIKENIFLPDGKILASVSAEPTWLQFNTTQGFAGIDSVTATVGNGAGMTVGVQWSFIPWGDQTPTNYESQIGPLAAYETIPVNGKVYLPIPQDSSPGTLMVTAIRNANGGDWIRLDQPSRFTVRPPKPASSTFVSPDVLQLPARPGAQRVHSANMKNQTIVVNMNLPHGNGGTDYWMPLNGGDPAMKDNGGDWHSGPLPCGIQPGDYSFISARNSLDSNQDASALWGSITPGPMAETVVPCN